MGRVSVRPEKERSERNERCERSEYKLMHMCAAIELTPHTRPFSNVVSFVFSALARLLALFFCIRSSPSTPSTPSTGEPAPTTHRHAQTHPAGAAAPLTHPHTHTQMPASARPSGHAQLASAPAPPTGPMVDPAFTSPDFDVKAWINAALNAVPRHQDSSSSSLNGTAHGLKSNASSPSLDISTDGSLDASLDLLQTPALDPVLGKNY